MPSDLESAFATWLRRLAADVPPPVAEYKFFVTRRWLFDMAWPEQRVAVELEGAVYQQGRHTRGKGYENDCEKYNAATCAGWRVLRFTSGMLEADPDLCIGQVVALLRRG